MSDDGLPATWQAPIWRRIGRYDSVGRRALWMFEQQHLNPPGVVAAGQYSNGEALIPGPERPFAHDERYRDAIVLRAGREGDDGYVELRAEDFVDAAKWRAFHDVMDRALYAAEDADEAEAP